MLQDTDLASSPPVSHLNKNEKRKTRESLCYQDLQIGVTLHRNLRTNSNRDFYILKS
jgi:hypothetical protein